MYVLEYQKFCAFLNRSIGDGNAHFYLLWLLCTMICIGMFNMCMIGCYWYDSEVILYYRVWDCVLKIYDQSFLLFLIYIVIQFAFMSVFQNFLWIFHATGRRQTINELRNSHNYRYIYKRVKDKETNQYLYIHRYYSYCDVYSNVWKFINNKLREKGKVFRQQISIEIFNNL